MFFSLLQRRTPSLLSCCCTCRHLTGSSNHCCVSGTLIASSFIPLTKNALHHLIKATPSAMPEILAGAGTGTCAHFLTQASKVERNSGPIDTAGWFERQESLACIQKSCTAKGAWQPTKQVLQQLSCRARQSEPLKRLTCLIKGGYGIWHAWKVLSFDCGHCFLCRLSTATGGVGCTGLPTWQALHWASLVLSDKVLWQP